MQNKGGKDMIDEIYFSYLEQREAITKAIDKFQDLMAQDLTIPQKIRCQQMLEKKRERLSGINAMLVTYGNGGER